MSHLKYSFPLGNDHSRLRSLFCSSDLVLPRPCWVGVGAAGEAMPIPPLSNGALGKTGKQADSSVSWHILAVEQPLELAASLCSLEQL